MLYALKCWWVKEIWTWDQNLIQAQQAGKQTSENLIQYIKSYMSKNGVHRPILVQITLIVSKKLRKEVALNPNYVSNFNV